MLAKEYYKLAGVYASTNHRSNYAIASMERKENDLSEALAYYKQSTLKQPTPFAFVNTGRSYEEQGLFFEAMFALKDGLKEFPGEPHISNNLSALYARTNLLDSAYYFLDNLNGDQDVVKVAETKSTGSTNQVSITTATR
jgi:tetratricopeptide (TPR) repeat protein